MGAETGQSSNLAPAVVFDNVSHFHMMFRANDSSNRLIYVTSTDRKNWSLAVPQPGGESTSSSPALALAQSPNLIGGGLSQNKLVAVYIANDSTQRLLFVTRDLTEPNAGWDLPGREIPNESAHWVSALTNNGPSATVSLYYIAEDPSFRILETQFTP